MGVVVVAGAHSAWSSWSSGAFEAGLQRVREDGLKEAEEGLVEAEQVVENSSCSVARDWACMSACRCGGSCGRGCVCAWDREVECVCACLGELVGV